MTFKIDDTFVDTLVRLDRTHCANGPSRSFSMAIGDLWTFKATELHLDMRIPHSSCRPEFANLWACVGCPRLHQALIKSGHTCKCLPPGDCRAGSSFGSCFRSHRVREVSRWDRFQGLTEIYFVGSVRSHLGIMVS